MVVESQKVHYGDLLKVIPMVDYYPTVINLRIIEK